MTARSILLGLGSVCLLGCFEDPPPPVEMDGSGSTTQMDPTATLGTTGSTTTVTPDPTVGMTSTSSTTVDPTTMSMDTTADSTTSEETTEGSSSTGPTDPCLEACMDLACGMQMMCDCGMCGADATCSMDQTYCALPIGLYNPFGFEASVSPDVQLGFRFTVFQPRTVRRLGVNAWGAGIPVQMALYDDDGLGPANRLAQTNEVMLYANGPNEWDIGATDIVAGDYWVMVHTGGFTPLRRTLNGDNNYEEALRVMIPFGDGFPGFMDDEQVIQDYRYNVYMIVED